MLEESQSAPLSDDELGAAAGGVFLPDMGGLIDGVEIDISCSKGICGYHRGDDIYYYRCPQCGGVMYRNGWTKHCSACDHTTLDVNATRWTGSERQLIAKAEH